MIDIAQQYWRAFLWTDGQGYSGVAVTLFLLLVSTVGGFLLAIPLAIVRASSNRYLNAPVWLYTYVFRGTPLYVQLLIIYTGIYSLDLVQQHEFTNSFFRSSYNCTILAFILNECAYVTEILAGAIRATPAGEVEAARAFGMSPRTLYTRLILPSAFRRALPTLSNEAIFMLHGTTVAFTATVPDILKVARDANAATYASFQVFTLAAILYLAISLVLIAGFRRAEIRWLDHLGPRQAKADVALLSTLPSKA
ncbi:amino acid ABC transporter permease (plasmid) [Paraburkholderia graminis]|uniref:ABC transporter permease n=1 Tax=Paraburkholderia graminis TaxID=60548 RepID=UPI000DF01A7B|nr:ABC transporter permease [Paraburkholderia graminis]AXF12615.1 amino acid ABC transporter permease [Paraburkholderia graminis]